MMSPSSHQEAAQDPPVARSEEAVVRVAGLKKSYGAVQALCGIDFSVPAGSVLGFLGPNGAGKTTAIKILSGYLAADEGRAEVCGFDVAQQPLEVKRRIGYLPENNPLYLDMRVEDFLNFAARAFYLSGAKLRAAVERAVTLTGLEEVYRRTIGHCSKGFRQRVGLAQALLHDPELLILDEPTNGLDPLQVVEMRSLIRELGRTKTIIITSHVLPEIEALADRVVLIHQGRKVADGPLASITCNGGGPCTARITVRGNPEQMEAMLLEADAAMLEERPAPFAEEGIFSALVEVDGSSGLAHIATAAANQDMELLELAPQSGTLESLFQNLPPGGAQ
ncbi:MAG: ABC transporter ATP-binding protein [Planctomycetota bacterium]|jgi:ABC-2 type transport system ATP-binding protein